MRVTIAAVGRLKDGAEQRLVERYVERLSTRVAGIGPIRIKDIVEGKQTSAATRRADEAERLLKAVEDVDMRIVLDENGKMLSSGAFARLLGERRDGGTSMVAFLIGGPDGHGTAALEAAHLKLSLGPMTLAHGLARVVLVEQIYRATTILSGHPYHRA
jgi:23S rRNA (pseudouridine1915-N3)-methyltransferase